jgi:hypothetical protein
MKTGGPYHFKKASIILLIFVLLLNYSESLMEKTVNIDTNKYSY